MKKYLLIVFSFLLLGCQPFEQSARDALAVSKGYIVTAQSQYHDKCVANPTASPCARINKAIAAQNVAVDALNLYCASPDYNTNGGTCTVDKSAKSQLETALANLKPIISDVKGLIK